MQEIVDAIIRDLVAASRGRLNLDEARHLLEPHLIALILAIEGEANERIRRLESDQDFLLSLLGSVASIQGRRLTKAS